MKKKMMWRYYCDFCKKAGCHAGHMRRHEERCTANPNRKCGMCEALGEIVVQRPSDLAASINPEHLETFSEAGIIAGEHEPGSILTLAGLDALRDKVEGCPACILATLRHADLYCNEFSYKDEHRSFWERVGENYLMENY